jgi:hypothetical protein
MAAEPQTRFKPHHLLAWPNGMVPRGKRAALIALLEDGETVLWTGSPDARSTLRTQGVLWLFGVPWLVLGLLAVAFGWMPKGWAVPALLPGIAFTLAPVLLAIYSGGTVYAITDRRAIIRHDALGKQETVSVRFEDMDAQLEILATRRGFGHLYFASNMPTGLSSVDHTGKLAFRELQDPEAVAALLERVRPRG